MAEQSGVSCKAGLVAITSLSPDFFLLCGVDPRSLVNDHESLGLYDFQVIWMHRFSIARKHDDRRFLERLQDLLLLQLLPKGIGNTQILKLSFVIFSKPDWLTVQPCLHRIRQQKIRAFWYKSLSDQGFRRRGLWLDRQLSPSNRNGG